jgi:hypothetical protein
MFAIRDGLPQILTWTYAEFLEAWHYFEPDSPRTNPYFGVAAFTWTIKPQWASIQYSNGYQQIAISASVNYPCFKPFNCSQFPAQNVLISLKFSDKDLMSTYVETTTPQATLKYHIFR